MFLKETSNIILGYYLNIYFSLNLYLLTKAFHRLQKNLSNKIKNKIKSFERFLN